jgi:hypothetical protein
LKRVQSAIYGLPWMISYWSRSMMPRDILYSKYKNKGLLMIWFFYQAIDQKDVQQYIFDTLNSCLFVGLRQWSKVLSLFTYTSRKRGLEMASAACTQACSMLIIGWLHWWQVVHPCHTHRIYDIWSIVSHIRFKSVHI